MKVDPAKAAGHVDYKGKTYYFCGKGCAAKFTADPEKYLSGKREPMGPPLLTVQRGSATPHAAPGTPHAAQHAARGTPHAARPVPTKYTCPMDPDVISDRPGACPK
jgi:Cu+-exporting ATPase